ncbi:DUF2188 domain-containing protein [Alsobacter sp. SYSU M60028]|uniref:DUF2188 domain-containing protein n=1 Tax=Alsobacter ponti TaxID=2962936 RepID=A0ABT1LIC9_9HYPH|nr:DUF2188 domain-containing protein [Alsobacter ponti]MCP8940871.1 DUF2188 domain-containing protein [Alsobacter ponti]
MSDVVYEIVPHDGGWAYSLGGAYSETFASREQAIEAAHLAAQEQRAPGEPAVISYQDADGRWREERARGGDRPHPVVRE